MTTVPETKYARSGNIHIAYQVGGTGPPDIILVPGFPSHVEYQWEEPGFRHLLHRLASFSRLICFDKRGSGLSDRAASVATLEERMDDVRAVLDAVGSRRAVLFGVSEGGPMSVLFAATYPDRTSALISTDRTPDAHGRPITPGVAPRRTGRISSSGLSETGAVPRA
jgi:pimeloyl-ACP methyl ester carboxylesterase